MRFSPLQEGPGVRGREVSPLRKHCELGGGEEEEEEEAAPGSSGWCLGVEGEEKEEGSQLEGVCCAGCHVGELHDRSTHF